METRPPEAPSSGTSPITLLAVMALLIFLVPSLCHLLELDWARVADGEIWRLLTGHLTHYDAGHLFWDLSMFAGLGLWCERYSVRRTFACALCSMIVITVGIPFLHAEVTSYRGLSGVDSALFMLFLAHLGTDALREKNWGWLAITGVGAIGLLGKIGYEVHYGATLFVDSAAAGFVPLPAAHLLGAMVGISFGVAAISADIGSLKEWPLAIECPGNRNSRKGCHLASNQRHPAGL